MIAKGQPGDSIQAGLVGVNVVSREPQMVSLGEIKDIEDELHGKIDFGTVELSEQ